MYFYFIFILHYFNVTLLFYIIVRYLPHTLIMAAALSLQEVFMMPNFMKGDSSLLSLVSSTQKARVWFDRGCFSDTVASVRVSFFTSFFITLFYYFSVFIFDSMRYI
jgi:hypothetical protein